MQKTDTIRKGNRRNHVDCHKRLMGRITKYPIYTVLFMLLFIVLIDMVGCYFRHYLGQKTVLTGGFINLLLLSVLMIPMLFLSLCYARNYMKISDHKQEIEQELIDKEKLLQAIAEATIILLKTLDCDRAFNRALEILGKATKTDRVYIFQNHSVPDTEDFFASQKYEWCSEGIEPQIHNEELQRLCYKSLGFKRWYELLASGEIVVGAIQDFPSEERCILEAQGIISLAIVPIFVDDLFWGFLGFDDCIEIREWAASEIALLYAAAASMGGAIKRVDNETHIQALLKNDFKHTVQNLQNLVFKCKRGDNREIYFTLFEGKLTEKIRLTTDMVFEKKLLEVFGTKFESRIRSCFAEAFKGQSGNFEIEYEGNTYYTVLSPIFEEEKVVEVVGSAIDITDLKKAEEQVRYMAYYDGLTGLPNRALFKEQLNYLISHAHRKKTNIVIMFLDLDRFKFINDTLGHAAGDELLKETAIRLKKIVREDDMVVRMGGDEFVLLFPEVSREENISKLAQKVLNAFKDSFMINGHEIFISTSIGISLYPYDGEDLNQLIKNADTAMYRAKELGRDNYQFYTESMNARALERLEMENNLRRALEKEELYLAYQPRMDLKTKEVLGVEALIRWNHPSLGLVSPVDFIPIAEETGLILSIGEWVLLTACKQAKAWHDMGYHNLRISVNISAVQFQKQDLVEVIRKVLDVTKLKPHLLELEITENMIMKNTGRTVKMIQILKSMGVKISIDDFGTGFSSLSYIKEFNTDSLKIDKSFVKDIGKNTNGESIINAIISMAHSLEMIVVAEGVETEQQLEFLSSKNCNEVQGFLFSRPIRADEIVLFLESKY